MGAKGGRNADLEELRSFPDNLWMCERCMSMVDNDNIKTFDVGFDERVGKYYLEWNPANEGVVYFCNTCLKNYMGLDMGRAGNEIC